MGLDQHAAMVDAHQLAIRSHLDGGVRRTAIEGHRVERRLELDVVVQMDLHLGPGRHREGLGVEGLELALLLVAEDLQRHLPRRPVEARPGHFQAPGGCLPPHVGQVQEGATLEEALPNEGHRPLHVGLVLGMAHPGRVGDEAPELGVLQKAPGQLGGERVGPSDGRRAVVQNQVLGDTGEEAPGGVQPLDDVGQGLVDEGPDEHVAAEREDDDERPDHQPVIGLDLDQRAQSPKVKLGELARWGLGESHRRLGGNPQLVLGDEARCRGCCNLAGRAVPGCGSVAGDRAPAS